MDTRENVRENCPENPQHVHQPNFEDLVGVIGRLAGIVQHNIINQVNHPQIQNTLDDFQRKNPPEFNGVADPDVADQWKMRLEKIFEAMECTSEQRVRFSVFMLTGEAEHWWRMCKARLEKDQVVITWAKFLEEFDKKYFSDNIRDKKEEEFNKLIQKDMSVLEYEAKFTSLCRFAPTVMVDEGRKARKFVNGLKLYIKEKMALFRYEDYDVAVTHALNVESNSVELLQSQNRGFKRNEFYTAEDRNDEKRQRGNSGGNDDKLYNQHAQPTCIYCGNRHFGSCAPICQTCKKRHFGTCLSGTGACFNCGEKGHHARICPNPRKVEPVVNLNKPENQRRNVTGRLFVMTGKEAETTEAQPNPY